MSSPSNSLIKIVLLLEEGPDFDQAREWMTAQDRYHFLKVEVINDALELIRQGGWDCIISGMTIGGENIGLEFLSSIRRIDQLTPFFFLTTENAPEMVSAAFQGGANDYFVVDGSEEKLKSLMDAVRVSVELARLLRAQTVGLMRSPFEEKYSGMFGELEEGSLMLSAETGKINFANDSIAASIGLKADEMFGRSVDDFLVSSADVASSWQELLRHAEHGSGITSTRMRHSDGSTKTFWTQVRALELSGSKVLLCQCRDVTRFEQMETEVISVRNQLKTIVDNSVDAIVLAREDGEIEFIGGAAPRLFGTSSEDMNLSTLDDLFADTAPSITKLIARAGDRNHMHDIESSIVSRWGTRIPVSVHITRLPSSDGITRFLINIQDITARKMIEAEKVLTAELIRIVSVSNSPVEVLPKLIEKIQTTVPIGFGLVVGVDDSKEKLTIAAVYNDYSGSELRVGQRLEPDLLPAEEELWLREGLVRNNLQEKGLHTLEHLLYREGVRSYVSVPLKENSKLVGGAHFGTAKPYALNRGHLSMFSEIAGAISTALLRAKESGEAERYRLFSSTLMESMQEPILLCGREGTVLEANGAARELLGAKSELKGRFVSAVFGAYFSDLKADLGWLRRNLGKSRPLMARDGQKWRIYIEKLGSADEPLGYSVSFISV